MDAGADLFDTVETAEAVSSGEGTGLAAVMISSTFSISVFSSSAMLAESSAFISVMVVSSSTFTFLGIVCLLFYF